ncbi:MAG TPA: TerC family protein [Candidatus Limnocylindrales bacterium]|nr:TerC family protein [Candidatus Limnocylindrales bacterium]
MPLETIGSPMLWSAFLAFVLAMLAIDLGVFHRNAHEVSVKEAAAWSAIWFVLAVIFNLGVYSWFGTERALEFATGYLIEKALAVDNIFVFVVIFSAFSVPARYQHRVLFWGVIGALVMRAAFIFAGAAFLQRFHWGIYVFGAILAITGIKLLLQRHEEMHPEQNPLLRGFQRLFPVTHEMQGDKFTIVRAGRRYATPLLLALLAVEITDLIFAVDSIPAIFAVTADPFIVFTSNIFAILGLRSLYFLLAGVITQFAYLKVGLSFVLIFVGAKMLLMDVYKIPIGVSLAAIAGILGASVLVSLWKPPSAREVSCDVLLEDPKVEVE